MWIGTADGLARFDGYEVRIFRYDPFDSTSLSNGTISMLLEDRHDVLWVGTENGLHTLDRDEEAFTRIALPGAVDDGISVSCALEDRDGRLWVGTHHSGLVRFDIDRNSLEHFFHTADDPSSLLYNDIRGIQEDAKGRIWVLTCGIEGCALQRSGGGGFFTVAEDLGATVTWTLAIDPNNSVWVDACSPVGTTFDDHLVLDGRACRTGVETWAIEPTSEGQLWFGTSAGLFRTAGNAVDRDAVSVGVSPNDYLATIVRSLHRGRSGVLWVGTHGGLYAIDPHAKRFNHWDLRSEPAPSRDSPVAVSSLAAGPADTLFVATFGAGLLHLDRSGKVLEHFSRQSPHRPGLPSDVIWSLYRAGQDLWIACEGLAKMDLSTGKITVFPLPDGHDPTFILAETGGRLWLAGFSGLAHFDPSTGQHSPVVLGDGSDSRRIGVQSLSLRERNLWIGSADALFRLDLSDDTLQRFALETPDGIGLRGTGTWIIHPDDRGGGLWLGTSVGLLRFDLESRRFSVISTGDGLPGSSVYSILADETGLMWIGTNQGLTRFDNRATGNARFRNYSIDDGLGNIEFNRNAAWKTPDGHLFFGGLDGLTWFHPGEIHDNPTVPPVRLTRIDVFGVGKPRQVKPYSLERLLLSPGDETIGLEFAALSYSNPERNQYAYKLEGFDPQWVEAGHRRYAQYTRVPPGAYTFRVRGSNNDGVWNNDGLSLPVVVQPAYWQTIWFRVTILALAVMAAYGAYCYRSAKRRELRQLRLQIAGDLHDDLSSDLSGIGVVADILQRQPNLDDSQRSDIVMIRDAARNMIEGLRDIVWYIDPEHDNFEATIDRMRSFAERLLRGVPYRITAAVPDRSPNLSMETRRDLFLVYKETLQNIVRHARASSVEVDFSLRDGALRVVVSDDGVGFDPDTVDSGHGLRSMRRRADQLGAALTIESQPGSGTRITLILDLARFRDGKT